MQLNHCIMYSLFTHKRICQHCGAEFVSQKSTTKYCSKRCANIAGKARNREYLLQLKQRSVTETRRQELMENPYLSLTQAAKLLQISRTTLYQLIKKYDLPLRRLTARTIRVAQEDLYKIQYAEKAPQPMPATSTENRSILTTREEVMETYQISNAWFFSQLKKHNIKATKMPGGGFYYNRGEMDRIFSNKQVLHITEWYTFSEVRDMSGLKTETICGIVKKHKIPKKKVNNIVYLSKRHWEEARGNTFNKEGYYTITEISEKYGLSKNHIFCLIKDKGVERIKIGIFAYFKTEDIDKVLTTRNVRK